MAGNECRAAGWGARAGGGPRLQAQDAFHLGFQQVGRKEGLVSADAAVGVVGPFEHGVHGCPVDLRAGVVGQNSQGVGHGLGVAVEGLPMHGSAHRPSVDHDLRLQGDEKGVLRAIEEDAGQSALAPDQAMAWANRRLHKEKIKQ